MLTTQVNIRVPDQELERWRAEAKALGLPLARWIRDRCSEGVVWHTEETGTPSPVFAAGFARAAAEKDLKDSYVRKALAPTKSRGTCKHGKTSTQFCPRCDLGAKI